MRARDIKSREQKIEISALILSLSSSLNERIISHDSDSLQLENVNSLIAYLEILKDSLNNK